MTVTLIEKHLQDQTSGICEAYPEIVTMGRIPAKNMGNTIPQTGGLDEMRWGEGGDGSMGKSTCCPSRGLKSIFWHPCYMAQNHL